MQWEGATHFSNNQDKQEHAGTVKNMTCKQAQCAAMLPTYAAAARRHLPAVNAAAGGVANAARAAGDRGAAPDITKDGRAAVAIIDIA